MNDREKKLKIVIHAAVNVYAQACDAVHENSKDSIAGLLSVLTSELTQALAATFASSNVDREKFIVTLTQITQDIKRFTISKFDAMREDL